MIALRKEGIAVASGNEVWAYSYSGELQRLCQRDGEVKSLTVYKGRLLDCGNYKGVRDTQTGRTYAGAGIEWRRIAAIRRKDFDKGRHEWKLYGAKENSHGIYDIFDSCQHTGMFLDRNGRTYILFGWGLLFDGGEYFTYGMGKEMDRSPGVSHDQIEYKICYYSEEEPITAGAAYGETIYYTTPLKLFMKDGWFSDGQYSLFALQTEIAKTSEEIRKILFFKTDSDWEQFCSIARRLRLRLPAESFTYEGKTRGVTEKPSDGYYRPIDQIYKNLLAYIRDNEGFSAVASADRIIFLGTMDGRLIAPHMHPQERHKFKHKINALCTIPEETMNDGIRQKAARRIQMRAVHAMRGRAVVKRA